MPSLRNSLSPGLTTWGSRAKVIEACPASPTISRVVRVNVPPGAIWMRFLGQLADAHLGPRQVGHQGDLAADGLRGRSQSLDPGRVLVERAVREIQTGHAHSRADHLFQNRPARRRPARWWQRFSSFAVAVTWFPPNRQGKSLMPVPCAQSLLSAAPSSTSRPLR